MVTSNPEIYGLDVQKDVKNIQKTAKEKLESFSAYQDILKDLETNVVLKETEMARNKLRIVSYATNANRGGSVDKGDGKGALWLGSKKIYESLANQLKDKPGYTPPADKEAKVFYDIGFRLKELGFDKNSKGEQLNFSTDYTNDLAIAIMAFQKMSGATKIESIVGPETFRKLLQGNVKVEQTVIENPVTDVSIANTPTAENIAVVPAVENNEAIVSDPDKMKEFNQIYTIANDLNNISKEELKALERLEKNFNKNDKLYNAFTQNIIAKIEAKYKDSGVKTFEGNIANNVRELVINFTEGYLEDNTPEQKNIEVDPKFYLAIKDTIVEWLSSDRPVEEKKWMILFVKSFTSNFNDILQSYGDTI